jgi:two-component system, cell cycle sensor histidine kinase and response regulator CckA
VVDHDQPERGLADADELRALLDALPLATAVKDRDGRFLYINAAASAGYGIRAQDMIGGSESALLPPGNDLESVLAADREVIDSGRSLTVPGHRFRTHEGRNMVLHMTREPVNFCGRQAVLVTAMDVTDISAAASERRQLERRLAEAQRVEGLGLLAGGIAHDFNNLLVGVLGNADLALLEVPPGSRMLGFLERIRTAADRLATLAHQMLTYTGRSPTRIQAVDLSAVIREMMDLVGSSVPTLIKVVLALPERLPAVAGDSAQLGQVIVNLVMNAAEAIGERAGTIEVSARQEHLDSDRNASLALRSLHGAGEYLCLEVRDDGPGMDEQTRTRIFEPFFSTKGSRGRGLGLASVIGIVRAHQGALQVDSTPGEGTRMRAWLPLAQELVRAQPSLPKAPSAPLAAGKRVLIVDDETVVRETAAAMLEAQAFTVLSSADGQSALEAAKNAGSIDVILLDLNMPGCSAEDVHRRLRDVFPQAGILLISGYSEPAVLAKLLEQPRTRFLRKPFSAAELSAQVHALLR